MLKIKCGWEYFDRISSSLFSLEGGFAPNIQDNKEGLELLKTAIAQAGYTDKVKIAMDVAASEFYKDGKYDLDFKNPNSDASKHLTGVELADLYRSFIKDYPIVSIEDPFDQDDFDSYEKLTSSVRYIEYVEEGFGG